MAEYDFSKPPPLNPTKAQQKEEIAKCMLKIEYFAKYYCKVWHKGPREWKPFIVLPHQTDILDACLSGEKVIVSKYRQAGVTTVICMFLAWKLTFSESIKVAVIADKLKLASDNLFTEIERLMGDLPSWMQNPPSMVNKQDRKKFANKAELSVMAATKEGLRGFSPDIYFTDEAAFYAEGEAFFQSATATMSTGGQCIMVSTPNGLDPIYHKTYESARLGTNDYRLVEIRWFNDERYNEDLIFKKGEEVKPDPRVEGNPRETKLNRLKLYHEGWQPWSPWFEKQCRLYEWDKKKIAQELENNFLGSGGNMIEAEVLERIQRQDIKEPIWTNKSENDFSWVWEHCVPDGEYVLGADAAGDGTDFSTISVLRILPDGLEQVMEYQGRDKDDDFGALILYWAIRYNNAYVVLDVTGGSGAVPMFHILETGYKNIHYSLIKTQEIKEKLSKYLQDNGNGKVLVPGFSISNAVTRKLLLNTFKVRLEQEELTLRSKRVIHELKHFVYNPTKDRYDHMRSTHDDLIFASAMAVAGWLSRGSGNDWLALYDSQRIVTMEDRIQAQIKESEKIQEIRKTVEKKQEADPQFQEKLNANLRRALNDQLFGQTPMGSTWGGNPYSWN